MPSITRLKWDQYPAETHAKVQMRQEKEHPCPGLKTHANRPQLLSLLLANVRSLENKPDKTMQLLCSYIQNFLSASVPFTSLGNHMADVDKTKGGSVRIYVSNEWCGDVQTEHSVNIVCWMLSSRCWSTGFLISQGNSVQCFCTAVYHHTSQPANISSVCRFYHRLRP